MSHLNDIGHGELIEAVKWAQERGFRLRLTAESNYFPGRTIQVEFESYRVRTQFLNFLYH